MNALIVLTTLVAATQAQLLAAPYGAWAGALPYAGAYGYGAPLAYNAPLAAAAAPLAAPLAAPVAPITAPSSQFQAQDEFGNLNYGYSNINSAKQEVGNTYGGVAGSYSYVDANGIPQRVDYIADALGFRVKATNLPVAPAVPAVAPLAAPVFDGVAPAPVVDTPEVAAAKAEFQAAYDEAASRTKREAILPYTAALPYAAGIPYAAGLPYATGLNYAAPYAAGYATPYAYGLGLPYATGYPYAAATYAAPAAVAPAATVAAAPAAAEGILTKIKLNPGHAIAYRID